MFSPKVLVATVLLMAATQAAPVLAHGDEHAHEAKDAEGHDMPMASKTIMSDYLAIQTALAGDSLKKTQGRGESIAKTADELSENFNAGSAGIDEKDSGALLKILPTLSDAAAAFSEAKDIEAARKAFGPLSSAMVSYRELMDGEGGPNVAYCPMVKEKWLQNGKKIANPYYGSKMLHCGEIVKK